MHVRKHIPRLWHGGHHAWLPIEVRTHSQTDAPRQTTIQYGARGKSVSNPWYTLCICLPVLLHVSYLYARNLFALRTGTLVDNLEKGNGDIMIMIDYADPKWRFEERVKRLVEAYEESRGITRAVAEEIVKFVIDTKEQSKESI